MVLQAGQPGGVEADVGRIDLRFQRSHGRQVKQFCTTQ
jgi:hypothetical protein